MKIFNYCITEEHNEKEPEGNAFKKKYVRRKRGFTLHILIFYLYFRFKRVRKFKSS